MISFIKKLFLDHWQRKLASLALAVVIWIVTNHSLTVTKMIAGVPIRVIHLPEGKTIEGMLENGILNTKINLNVNGNKESLEELSSKNLEVVIDAYGQPDQWIASIDKKNLQCTNPGIDLSKAIAKIVPQEMIIKQTKLITEKIPVLITQPIGEAPKEYQFLDVWPCQLYVTINGPEEVVKKLKKRELKLTFNLNEIYPSDLDGLQNDKQTDEISFLVPTEWKKISVPQISDHQLDIDDPQAKFLRINFSRQDYLAVGTSFPMNIYFPSKHSTTLNPETYSIATNDFVVKKNGIKTLSIPLYARGMSRTFLETVKDMIQITVIAAPKSERETLLWNAQFIYPHELENRYVAKVLSESGDDTFDILPHMREEYLRNRFRRYMNEFRFYTAGHQKLGLNIDLQANSIAVLPKNDLSQTASAER